MTAIFGWIGVRESAADTALSAMDIIGLDEPFLSRSGLTLLHRSGRKASYAEEEHAATAIIGTPVWKDAALLGRDFESDHASVLMEAYKRHSNHVERYGAGHFAMAVLDKAMQSVLLALDRFGTESLYYCIPQGGGLVFGSTPNSLRRHPAVSIELDPQSIFDYIYFQMIPSPSTVYKGIHKLEPGQCLVYRNDRIELRRYWQPDFSEDNTTSFGVLKKELNQSLHKAISRCQPDEHTGAFLSGGLDSSTVAGILAQQRAPHAVNTYSIGFAAAGYDEIEYARAAGKQFGLRMHEYYVTPEDVADAMPQIAQAYDEPFGNSSAVPTLFCARFAKQHGTNVLLAGDGGDELFAGNTRYLKQKVFDLYHHLPRLLKTGLLEPLLLRSPIGGMLALRKLRSYIEQANLPMPDRMESYNFLHRTPLEQVFTADFLAGVDTEHPLTHLRRVYQQCNTASLINRMLYLDWKITLADNDLRKVGHMCELAGVEVRYPMLDDELVDFSLRVPASLKIKGINLRYFYKQAMRGLLPKKIIDKSKHGFGLPFGEWLRDSARLQELVGDSLQSLKKRHIIRSDFIDGLIEAHRVDHAAYYGSMIWVMTMLELWLDCHLPQSLTRTSTAH